jgi:hypothetical protein
VSVGRDGRQGWSRESEAAWLRVFGEKEHPPKPEPQTVAFPDHARKLYEGFK